MTQDARPTAIQARFSASELEAIENWRRAQPRIPPLAGAMRTLVRLGLEAVLVQPIAAVGDAKEAVAAA